MDDLELRARLAIAEAKVSELTVRLRMARDSVRRYRDLHRRRRVPVLIESHANGDVFVYAENGAVEIECVDWPNCGYSEIVEEWLTWQLGERHRAIYLPSCVEARVYPLVKRVSLLEAYERWERWLAKSEALRAMLDESKKERQHFERKQHAPKKTTNARTAAGKRRARGVE